MGPHRGGVGESDLGVSGKEIRIKGNEFCLDEQTGLQQAPKGPAEGPKRHRLHCA